MCMSLRSNFLPESTVKKVVKIGQYLAKIWKKYNSLLFWPTLYIAEFKTIRNMATRQN